LGHRFIPHPLSKNKNLIDSEFNETHRKLSWKLFFDQKPTEEQIRYVRYIKGSWPAEVYSNQLLSAIEKAKELHSIILDRYANLERPQKQFTEKYWKSLLASMTTDSRFLQCDKNLGIRSISEDEYVRLAARESRNYRYIEDISSVNEGMCLLTLRFSVVAACISSAIKPTSKEYSAEHRKVLQEIASFMHFTLESGKEFSFPKLRMLIKVHKPRKADGLYATRPIIPNFGLPSYGLAKWLGAFMARMAKTIPWNLESTDHFLSFILNTERSPNIASFDFTNLYGNEPVEETLSLFFSALLEWDWKERLLSESDKIIFEALMVPISVPDDLVYQHVFRSSVNYTNVFCLLVAECIVHTIAELDMGRGKKIIVITDEFLAMGCPPVAPLSVITLAYLESQKIGYDKCVKGMRRLIDDIIIDENIIPEELLRSAYPDYLELNYSERGHFLDVSYAWIGDRFMTFPFIKPHTTIPLNINSCHPFHVLRAAAKNELVRILKLCSENENKKAWSEFWRAKYYAAGYNIRMLFRIEAEVSSQTIRMKCSKAVREVNHIETFIGTETKTGRSLSFLTKRKVSQTWRVGPSLLSMALKAHERKNDKELCPVFLLSNLKSVDSKTPDDGYHKLEPKSFGSK